MKTKKTRFSNEERELIENLIKEGANAIKISEKLGRSVGAIYSEIKRGGGKKEYNCKNIIEKSKTKRHPLIKPFTEEETRILKDLISKGAGVLKIYYLTGISTNRIYRFLSENKLSTKQNKPDLNERVNRLENFIQIIFDELERLRKIIKQL